MGKPASRAAVLRVAAAVIVLASAAGCGRTDYDDGAGFHDGFLASFTRDCAIRPRPGKQGRHNPAYSRGFADGIDRGLEACLELRNEPDRVAFATASVHARAR